MCVAKESAHDREAMGGQDWEGEGKWVGGRMPIGCANQGTAQRGQTREKKGVAGTHDEKKGVETKGKVINKLKAGSEEDSYSANVHASAARRSKGAATANGTD